MEEKKVESRKKPRFLRKDWHKKIKLGSTVKKKRKWRAAKGRQNKIRLGIKGHSTRPKIGWGTKNELRGKVNGLEVLRIENVKQLESANKGQGIIIASVGKKKREEILSKAKELKIKVLNKYKENKK